MMITRAMCTAALTVVFAAGAAGPAMAATAVSRAPHAAAPTVPVPNAACSALTAQLVSQLTSAATGLLAVPPNPAAVTDLVGQLIGDITALQSSGCLPAVPPAPGGSGAPTACVPDVAKLLSDVYGLVADLTKSPPDTAAALTAVTTVLSDIKGLFDATYLPAVPLPPIPGLPGLPGLPGAP